ncbi:tetratricopeptide repeat protein [bacterium]|nr:tetratricopeptide repeat protein [bacterium]
MANNFKDFELELQSTDDIKDKIDIFNDFAWEIRNNNSLFAIELSKQAKEFSEKISYTKGLGYSLRNLGACNIVLSNFDEAFENLEKALKIFIQTKEKQGEASVYNNLGNAYRILRNSNNALEFYLKSLEIYKQLKDEKNKASILNNIGIVYHFIGDLDLSLKYYLESIEIKQNFGDKRSIASSLNNIGNIHRSLGNFEKALEYNFESMKIKEELQDSYGLGNSLNNIGNIYSELGDFKTASDYHFKSLEIAVEINNDDLREACFRNIGEVYKELGSYQKSLEFQMKSLQIIEQKNKNSKKGDSLNLIGETYNHLDLNEKAISTLADALENNRKFGNIKGEIHSLLFLGNVYAKIKNINNSTKFLEEALYLAQEIKSKPLIKKVCYSLFETYKKFQKPQKALEFFRKFHEVEEQTFIEQTNQKIKSLQISHEVENEQADKEIYFLKNIDLKKLQDILSETQDKIIQSEIKSVFNYLVAEIKKINDPLTVLSGNLTIIKILIYDKLDEKEKRVLDAIGNAIRVLFRTLENFQSIDEPELIQYIDDVNMINIHKKQEEK